MASQGLTLIIIVVLASILSKAELRETSKLINYSVTLPLIHRDTSNSPFYDPKLSQYDRIKSVIGRSIDRAKLLSINKLIVWQNPNVTEIILNQGEYFMNISIGTPSFPFLAMINTCSQDNWLECNLCEHCHEQKEPLFDLLKSSTSHPSRTSLEPFSNKNQLYKFYSDEFSVNFQDTITMGSLKLPNHTFDCIQTNQGTETFSSIGSGVIGLLNIIPGEVPTLQESIGKKFSYCLTPLASNGSKSSEINFGENAAVSGGDGVVSTPISVDPISIDPIYKIQSVNLTLKAITVGEKRIPWNTKPTVGNIIIDLGTTLLMLESIFYDAIESEIRNQVKATTVDDSTDQLKLCYNSDGFKPPKLMFNFEGMNVTLNDFNAWIATSDNIICFAAVPSSITIYGNLAQRNFLIGYDMNEAKLSFKPTDCSK